MANRWGYWEFAGGRFSPKEVLYEECESLPDVYSRAGMPANPGSQFGFADQGFMIEVYALRDGTATWST